MIQLEALDFDNTIVKHDDGLPAEVHQNIWDCLGDIMMRAMIDEKLTGIPAKDCDIFISRGYYFRPKYYTAQSLLSFCVKMLRKGWKIHMDKNNVFYMKCPAFDTWHEQFSAQPHTAQAATNIYAHPTDSQIINFLDMPGVKSVFGSAIDMMTDLNFSTIISSGVAVNANSFPEINGLVNHCVSVLGIKKPYVVISGDVNMNAFTVGSDEEPYIVLGSALVKAMEQPKLKFIVGHECGHIAMGHVLYHTLVSSASSFVDMVPVLGPVLHKTSSFMLTAWSRRSEITADRAGLLCCGDIDEACRALAQLQTGFISAENIDMNNYVKNSKRYRRKGTLKRVGEFFMTHPPLPKRIEALKLFAESEPYYQARGLDAPKNCLTKKELTRSVENIIAVLGGE